MHKKMRSLNQDGIALVLEIVIGLVVLSVIGGVAFTVLHHKKPTTIVTTSNTANHSSSQTTPKKSTTTNTPNPTPNTPAPTPVATPTPTPAPTSDPYAKNIQILSISDNNVITFKLDGLANTNSYYQNWTISNNNLTGHTSFTATQSAPGADMTTPFQYYSYGNGTQSTFHVEICENGGKNLCSNQYTVTRN